MSELVGIREGRRVDEWGSVWDMFDAIGRWSTRASKPPPLYPIRFPVAWKGISHHLLFLLSTAGTVGAGRQADKVKGRKDLISYLTSQFPDRQEYVDWAHGFPLPPS